MNMSVSQYLITILYLSSCFGPISTISRDNGRGSSSIDHRHHDHRLDDGPFGDAAEDQWTISPILDEFINDSDINHEPESNPRNHFEKTCPRGFFSCYNGECLSPKWRCDGHYDCDDFSDELNCTDIDIPNINIQSSNKKPKVVTAPPLPPKEEIAEIHFESESEPLMLFSTGTSVRGHWMRSRIYFDIVDISLPEEIKKLDRVSITQVFSLLFGKLSSDDGHSETKDKTSVQAHNTIVGVDMDPTSKQVYWVELGKYPGVFSTRVDNEQFEKFSRRQFSDDEPNHQTIVDSGLLSPEDLALDTIGKNLYITDAGLPAIVVCSIEHGLCRVLTNENIHKPRAIVVDSTTGWLMYTDWGDHPGIYLVSMDGRRRETLIDKDIVWPNGLAHDQSNGQLYWADARLSKIERVDLKTRQRQVIIVEAAANPFSLSLFESHLYWSDWSGSDIRTCDKTSGNGTQVIMRADNIYGIHIYHPSLYPSKEVSSNPCWSKKCSHMCLLGPAKNLEKFDSRKVGSVSATCACPETMALSIGDKATCYDVLSSFLLINADNYVAQGFPERIGVKPVETLINSDRHVVHDIASDRIHYRLFFFDAIQQEIFIVTLNKRGHKVESFLPTSSVIRGLTYDSLTDNLIWVDSNRGTLTMASVKGHFEKTLRTDLGRPFSLVLDSKNRYLYVAIIGHDAKIIRTELSTTNSQHTDIPLVTTNIGIPLSLYLDESAQRLYWADAKYETIESIDLNVTSPTGIKKETRRIHKQKLGLILAFTLYKNRFLWMIKNSNYLYSAKAEDDRPVGLKLPIQTKRHSLSDNKRILVVEPKHEILTNACSKKGCSHGCIVDSSHVAQCVCPDSYRLHPQNRTNCISAVDFHCDINMFKCHDNSHCISNQWRCDGSYDCDDGSDEDGCEKSRKCPQDDFTCANGHCISKAWRCDGTEDCSDGSDELDCDVKSKCRDDSFTCSDGYCIAISWRCDGTPDCTDASDEAGCENACLKDQFKCDNGLCIKETQKCDTIDDCGDSSDEKHCSILKPHEISDPSSSAAAAAAASPHQQHLIVPTDDESTSSSGATSFVIVLVLIAFTALVALVSLIVMYRQGRLPRQVSQLSVSFISPRSHDKDGTTLLLDPE